MHILSNKSLSLIGGGGQSKFTLIELLVVLLVLGILMAIAIPMIGGIREASNSTHCRANLTQLHTALMAYSEMDGQPFPNIAGSRDLGILIASGYIKEGSKLGDCPGHEDKQTLTDSSYEGGPELTGDKNTLALTEKAIILADTSDTYHKAGKNQILMDGSFSQEREIEPPIVIVDVPDPLDEDNIGNNVNPDELLVIACITGDVAQARRAIVDLHANLDYEFPKFIFEEILGRNPGVNYPFGNPPRHPFNLVHHWTPLRLAIKHGHKEIVELILAGHDGVTDGDVNVDWANPYDDWTPLHYAVYHGYKEIVELLLDDGANIEATADVYNWTPLHYAVFFEYKEIVELLLDDGANIEAIGGSNANNNLVLFNATPLHYAVYFGYKEIVELLLDNHANLEAIATLSTIDGYRPFNIAIFYRRKEITKLLVDNGADTTIAMAGSSTQPLSYLNDIVFANPMDPDDGSFFPPHGMRQNQYDTYVSTYFELLHHVVFFDGDSPRTTPAPQMEMDQNTYQGFINHYSDAIWRIIRFHPDRPETIKASAYSRLINIFNVVRPLYQ